MNDPVARLNAALQGRYRIERELGVGGMATVYLATDLKHDRGCAQGAEARARGGRGRGALPRRDRDDGQPPASAHPALFDSGEAESFLFYVMPYVQGDTLADRIGREKQLPVDEAIGIATSVASALQHAHDRADVVRRPQEPSAVLVNNFAEELRRLVP